MLRKNRNVSVGWKTREQAPAAFGGEDRTGAQGQGSQCSGSCVGTGSLGEQEPSVNLKESKVGEEGGSLKMSPGQSTDPKGRPGLEGQQPRHLAQPKLGSRGACCRG